MREIERSEAICYLRHRGICEGQANQWYDWFVMYKRRKPTYSEVFGTAFLVRKNG